MVKALIRAGVVVALAASATLLVVNPAQALFSVSKDGQAGNAQIRPYVGTVDNVRCHLDYATFHRDMQTTGVRVTRAPHHRNQRQRIRVHYEILQAAAGENFHAYKAAKWQSFTVGKRQRHIDTYGPDFRVVPGYYYQAWILVKWRVHGRTVGWRWFTYDTFDYWVPIENSDPLKPNPTASQARNPGHSGWCFYPTG